MKMKKNVFFWFLAIVSFVFLGCVSINPQNVEQGKIFKGYYDWIDSDMPIEEHAVLINLGDFGMSISGINGKKATSYMVLGIEMDHIDISRFTILPPGDYSIRVFWTVASTTYGHNTMTITGQNASGEITATLLSGHYYYLHMEEVDSRTVAFLISDLNNVQEVLVTVDNKLKSPQIIPSENVIAGINAVIRKRR